MGVVANWGPYTWSVAGGVIKTFNEYTRKTAYKTEQVEDDRNKPGTARIAPELIRITFSTLLSRDLGTNAQAELQALRAACEAGEPSALIFGGVPASNNGFLLKSVGEKDAVWGPGGQMLQAVADLEFEEYVKEKARPPVVTESPSSAKTSSGSKAPSTKKLADERSNTTAAEDPRLVPPVYKGGGGGSQMYLSRE